MSGLRALLWDVDGTLAETERDGHLVAFNQAFDDMGLPWRWDEARYARLLRVTGGRERLLHDMADRADAPADPARREALARELHTRKNRRYAERVDAGLVTPRPGVLRLIGEARAAGALQAIVTTTSRTNVDALLGRMLGPDWHDTFAACVCGEDVEHKKPHPQAHRLSLQQLGLRAEEALALEDSEVGLQAADAAGLAVLLTPSVFFPATAQSQERAWACCTDLDCGGARFSGAVSWASLREQAGS
ncbi:HAD-IA family hydrolase [Sphaerotilus mobilis]|uniref:HAD superfamily hydrolase (TIGR01509 family) n=1 Tax=Sphaerotilus mobilis TaxID=47994 RepID=A0A4Q7LKV9_9BURK|nr:HAD-IA family hydrolase [Sphaerotilus mobilis]RZS54457.1 HAD superfamily hydrolase (TIGR01509 family) [Sphaerotilus mobilis]